eukprot:gene5260-7136_t
MTDKTDLIPPSPAEADYVKQVTEAEPLPLLPEGDPIALFETWLTAAHKSEPNDGNAMALATVDEAGMPDVRMVLLKDVDADGFVFYTNLQSAKGRELAANPVAALLFHWKSLRRQVRVRGTITPVSDAEADAYYASRARHSQIGAEDWFPRELWPAMGELGLHGITVAEEDGGLGLGYLEHVIACEEVSRASAAISSPPATTSSLTRLAEAAARLSAIHRLAKRKRIEIKDLREEEYIVLAPDSSDFARSIMDWCVKAGFLPHIAHVVIDSQSIIGLIAAGFGVALLPASIARLT